MLLLYNIPSVYGTFFILWIDRERNLWYSDLVMRYKEFTWHSYTVQITKKKIKNVNLRIKQMQPEVLCLSIPYSMSYASALKLLEEPRMQQWIEEHQKKVEDTSYHPMNQEAKERYQRRLQEMLPALFQKWESALGVSCHKVTIRDTRSQWGSCSIRTKNISISVWLGAYPEECIEYVIVHELAHLLEAGHNARFYQILDQYYPNWKSCREQLKKGQ